MWHDFISGAVCFGHFAIALFFYRFWRKSMDPLFAKFAAAFVLFGIERIVLVVVNPENEARPYVFLVRLLGFSMIIVAIVYKNRPKKERPPTSTVPLERGS